MLLDSDLAFQLLTQLTLSAFFAYGSAVLDYCWYSVFPRGARENRIQSMGSTMLPQAKNAPNVGDRVCHAIEYSVRKREDLCPWGSNIATPPTPGYNSAIRHMFIGCYDHERCFSRDVAAG